MSTDDAVLRPDLLVAKDGGPVRCAWAGSDPAMVAYHDTEWGVPNHDERFQFEMLVLEGAQAGLSWSLILKRRAGYRSAFADFDIETLAGFSEEDEARLALDPDIIRNRSKIHSAVNNARRVIELHESNTTLDAVLWAHVGGELIRNSWTTLAELPAFNEVSVAMSRRLKSLGFTFVGPTVCYSHMQAVGMVNDHLVGCDFRR